MLHTSTSGSGQRQSDPKSIQMPQLDEDLAVEFMRILGVTSPESEDLTLRLLDQSMPGMEACRSG